MNHTITLNYPNDETITISIDGEEIGSFDHSNHGWVGMEGAKALVVKLAEKLGIEIIETFEQ